MTLWDYCFDLPSQSRMCTNTLEADVFYDCADKKNTVKTMRCFYILTLAGALVSCIFAVLERRGRLRHVHLTAVATFIFACSLIALIASLALFHGGACNVTISELPEATLGASVGVMIVAVLMSGVLLAGGIYFEFCGPTPGNDDAATMASYSTFAMQA